MAQQAAKTGETYSGPVELWADGEFVAPMSADLSTKAGPRTDWGGTLTPTESPIVAVDPGSYTVRLPDGREGELIVTRATIKTSRGAISQIFEVLGNSEPPF